MEVVISYHSNNSFFNTRGFTGFYGELSDVQNLVDNLEDVLIGTKRVSKYIKFNKDFFNYLGLDRDILKKKVSDLSYSDYKLVMLINAVLRKPKIIILNNFDVGFNHKNKSRISKFIKFVNASLHINFVLITNDVIFMNKCSNYVVVYVNNILKYQGNIIDAIKNDYMEKPPIFEFIDKANEAGANLDYTLDNRELLKSIYRSVF